MRFTNAQFDDLSWLKTAAWLVRNQQRKFKELFIIPIFKA